ncbi:ABC1 kinase family protein [Roseococcus pinisoli]|uniref:Ubiquinone biosynthesis protein UbiB n=1 Tax=Roseococcus pinisoli TaxID=2835040 RepID=A0ABS5QAV4_9PROT|nr:AarF/UbiB family protein [Roseococcus pinisoli]MBS7810825.1 ubiquinone biosynthesis protein UbiB [Roseococcus pinisoli]
MLQTTMVAARDRKRLAEIVAVLARHGMGDIASRLGLGGLLPRGASGVNGELSRPQRLRLAIEALGTTFIKLGQILSTRADLLPPDWIAELEKLQSHVPAVPWEQLRGQVEEDLGGPPEEVFAEFDAVPLAAASIAQVYRARLRGGEEVVVKVRRPDLRTRVEADLRLLGHVAGLVEENWPELARFRPVEILRHLGAALSEELDLSTEGRNAETVARNLAEMPDIVIPRIHAQWTCERLLVQEFLHGTPPNDAAALAAAGHDGRVLAERGSQAFLRMALVDGVFHADPHPGNLRALPGDRVGFIDFGMVGRIGARRREQLVALVGAMVRRDAAGVANQLLEWSGRTDLDLGRLEADCDAFVARYGEPPLRLGAAITDIMAMARANELALPADLALLFKALITADGVMHALDPDFDALRVAAPIIEEEMRRRFLPANLFAKGGQAGLDLLGLAREAPALLRLLTLRLRQGRLLAEVELRGLDRIGADIRWGATRLAVAIVTAAFALGMAPRLLDFGPVLFGIPVTALAGFGVILIGLAWLIVPRGR